MDELAGIPATYRATGPTFDPLWAEPWAPTAGDLAAVEAALFETLENLPSAVTDVRWPTGWTGLGGAAAADLQDVLYVLLGAGSLATGTAVLRLLHALDPWRTEPYNRNDLGFMARNTALRPPDTIVFRGLAHIPRGRIVAVDLFVAQCRAWATVPPLAARANALVALATEQRLAPAAGDPAVSSANLSRLWAAAADPTTLDLVPELYGMAGYIEWCLGRLDVLTATAAGILDEPVDDVDVEVAVQVKRLTFDTVPALLHDALDRIRPGRAARVAAHLAAVDAATFSNRDILQLGQAGRLLLRGRLDVARMLIDTRSRLSLAFGLGASAAYPWTVADNMVWVADRLHEQVRSLVGYPRPAPPTVPPAAADDDGSPSTHHTDDDPFVDINGQADLVGELRACVQIARSGAPAHGPHLLLSGPVGTGQRGAARAYARALADVGVGSGAVHPVTATELVGPATWQLNPLVKVAEAFDRAGNGVLLLEGLDRLVLADSGQEALESIRRRLSESTCPVTLVATAGPDGAAPLAAANADLVRRFRVARTVDLDSAALVELFVRLATAAGMQLDDDARAAVSEVLGSARASGAFRNARIAEAVLERALAERLLRQQPRVRVPLRPHPLLPRLRRRGPVGHLRPVRPAGRRRGRAAGARPGGTAPEPPAPRPDLRQRPQRPQPVRTAARGPGRPPRHGRTTDRPGAAHAHRCRRPGLAGGGVIRRPIPRLRLTRPSLLGHADEPRVGAGDVAVDDVGRATGRGDDLHAQWRERLRVEHPG